MQNRLFVGNLPYEIQESELEEIFAKVGKVVSVKIITDKYSGRSKGFGFVEYETEEDAKKAIETLNETEVGGRKIAIDVAKPRREE